MTKHAFLLIVYSQADYVKQFIEMLDSERSNIYIHIDPNFINDYKSLIEYSHKNNIHYYSEYKMMWGGVGIINAQAKLINEALKDTSNEFFHLLTCHDILCRPLNELFEFFDKNNNKQFITYEHLPKKEWLDNGGINRYEHYHIYDLIKVRNYPRLHLYSINHTVLSKLQTIFHIHRKQIFKQMYGGGSYWSLNRDGAKCLDKYLSNKDFIKRCKYCWAPDEFIPQSILLNNDLNVENNNLRYIDWNAKGVSLPKTLEESDYNAIIQSKAFFARKIDINKSNKLIQLIKNRIS